MHTALGAELRGSSRLQGKWHFTHGVVSQTDSQAHNVAFKSCSLQNGFKRSQAFPASLKSSY